MNPEWPRPNGALRTRPKQEAAFWIGGKFRTCKYK